jgi:hypothetical protein
MGGFGLCRGLVRLVNGDETGEYVRMREARRRGRRREEEEGRKGKEVGDKVGDIYEETRFLCLPID